jgi:succinyl-diaminopimelate desuccinylase
LTDGGLAAWIQDRRSELVALVQDLIRARSENPPGDESECATIVLRELGEVGATVEVFQPVARRMSVVGVIDSGRAGPSILCNAHLDTVPAGDGWTVAEPFSGTIKRGRIYGRGASDHKSPIACLLYAVRALLALDRLRGRVIVVFDADEELGGTLGMRAILDSWNPGAEMALYAAPTSYGAAGGRFFGFGTDNVFRASVGRLKLRTTYSTRTSYQVAPNSWWYPAEVAAAIGARSAGFLHQPEWFGGNPRMRLVESVNGRQTWDVFVLPWETPEEVHAEVSRCILRSIKAYGRCHAEVEMLEAVPAADCPDNHQLVQALVGAASEATGRVPYVGALPAYTGMSPIQEKLKIPVVAFGYGRIDLCHTPNEWISVQQVVSSAQAYAIALSQVGHV